MALVPAQMVRGSQWQIHDASQFTFQPAEGNRVEQETCGGATPSSSFPHGSVGLESKCSATITVVKVRPTDALVKHRLDVLAKFRIPSFPTLQPPSNDLGRV